jgi:hypothetical protein
MRLVALFRHPWRAAGMCLALCACDGAEWSNVKVASPYRRPTHGINLSVVATASADHLEECVREFTTMLVDALKEDGLEATVDFDSPKSDQVRLDIAEWDPGSQAIRYFIGFGVGEGHIVVVVDVKDAGGTSTLHGRVRGYVAGGLFGGSAKNAAQAAARSIADAVDTGNPQ